MSYFSPQGNVPPQLSSRSELPFFTPETKDSFPKTTAPMPLPTTDALKKWKIPTEITHENLPSIDDPSQISELISDLLVCDDYYCEEAKSMYMDAILEVLRVQKPQSYLEIIRCNQRIPDHMDAKEYHQFNLGNRSRYSDTEASKIEEALAECKVLFQNAHDTISPQIELLLNQQRAVRQGDRLFGFDAMQYPHPFWYEGAGDIWRRVTNNSVRVSVDDCRKVRRNAEQCILDKTRPNNYCFHLYKQAIICEPGANCPYLRLPMLTCIDKHQDGNYQNLKNCIDMMPNVELCRQGFVPIDPLDNDPVEFKPPQRIRSLKFDGI